MEWFKRYNPPLRELWKGRDDGPAERYHQIIQCVDLRERIPTPSSKPAFALLGFACDEGIRRNQGRVGAAQGPQSLRKSLSNLPAASIPFYDCGDITCTDGNLEESQASLAILVAMLLAQKITPIVIGGGHELAWGTYQGICTYNPSQECAIINFDAHYDLRPLVDGKGTSGTSFLQISQHLQLHELPFYYYPIGIQKLTNTSALHMKAKKLAIDPIFADDIISASEQITKILSKHSCFYLTVCLDVFAAPFAPGVSAPQPLGVLPHQIIPLITTLARSGKVLVLDIAELSPTHDISYMTSSLAALLTHNFLASITQSSIN